MTVDDCKETMMGWLSDSACLKLIEYEMWLSGHILKTHHHRWTQTNPLPLTKIQTHYHWQRFKPTTTDKDSNPLPLTKIQTHYHWQRFKPTTTDKDSNPLPLTKIQTHYHWQRFKPTTTDKDSNPPPQCLSHYKFNMQTTTSCGDFQVEIKASFVYLVIFMYFWKTL